MASVIDGFGHNGHRPRKRFRVVGSLGKLVWLVENPRNLVLAVYAEPQVGTLFEKLPMIDLWPGHIANAEHYNGPVAMRPTRGSFDREFRWTPRGG